MHAIGFVFYALAAAMWLGGGRSVVARYRRRTGTEQGFPFRASISLWRDFNSEEKRQLICYFLGALLLGFVGSAFANGVFGS